MIGKKLGQNFLVNPAAIRQIIAALDLQNKETIIEIGPGKGALTLPLIEKCQKIGCQIIGIEKDHRLAEDLEFRIQNLGTVKIIKDDALKIFSDPKSYILYPEFYKIVGNIPYYITGKLLRILSELKNKPELAVLTVQREVAERIIAKPPRMNLLAAAVQFWAESEIIGYLKPSDFQPAPKIESAIIRLATRVQPIATRIDEEKYYKLIKIIFKQPRKTLLNNLVWGLTVDKSKILKILEQNGIPTNSRPQDLSLELISKILERVIHFF